MAAKTIKKFGNDSYPREQRLDFSRRTFGERRSMVSTTTRAAKAGSSFLMRVGRVLSRSSPSKPSAAKRSCQRQMQVLNYASLVHDRVRDRPCGAPGAPNMLLWTMKTR
jgi:hypothetical protein